MSASGIHRKPSKVATFKLWSNPTTDRLSRPSFKYLNTDCLFRFFRLGFPGFRSKAVCMGTNESETSTAAKFLYGKINSFKESGVNFRPFYLDTDGAWRCEMKEKLEIKLGPTLNRLMHEHGVSLKELAIESGVPQSTISHMRRNRQPRDISTVMAVAQALDVSLHYLLYGHGDPSEKSDLVTNFSSELFSGVFEITVKKLRRKS